MIRTISWRYANRVIHGSQRTKADAGERRERDESGIMLCLSLESLFRVIHEGHRVCCVGYENCPFYKDHAQYNADLDLHYQRLRQLPQEEQRAIADKYYHGRMPWVMSGPPPAWPEKPLRF